LSAVPQIGCVDPLQGAVGATRQGDDASVSADQWLGVQPPVSQRSLGTTVKSTVVVDEGVTT
jgi:hypothetical protein